MEKPRNQLIECDPFDDAFFLEEDIKIWECIHGYRCKECPKTYAIIQKKSKEKISGICQCGRGLVPLILGGTENHINNITTVGQLAEKNTKRMGKYELQEKRQAVKDNKKLAKETLAKQSKLQNKSRLETGDSNDYQKLKKINQMTPEQKQKYIETGDG